MKGLKLQFLLRLVSLLALLVLTSQSSVLIGQYQFADGRLFTVSREGGHLFLQESGETRVELFAESSVRFFYKMVDIELMLVQGSEGKVTQMDIYQGGQTLVAKKIN